MKEEKNLFIFHERAIENKKQMKKGKRNPKNDSLFLSNNDIYSSTLKNENLKPSIKENEIDRQKQNIKQNENSSINSTDSHNLHCNFNYDLYDNFNLNFNFKRRISLRKFLDFVLKS